MSNAKDFPNTVEFLAEKLLTESEKYVNERLGDNVENFNWITADESIKDYIRFKVITVLNSLNYFAFKTCKDCGYFDPIDKTCFGEDREHPEDPDKPICGSFCPPSLIEVEEVTTDE